MENLKNKVEARLIGNGNNADDVKKMMNLHFAEATIFYNSAKAISEYIRTVY